MNNSMARQRYSTSRPTRNRKRRIPQHSGGLRKLIIFQSLICALVLLVVIITKSIHISATDYITTQIRYVLEHSVEPKSIIAYTGKLAADIRDSIIQDSNEASDADKTLFSDTTLPLDPHEGSELPHTEATQETPTMEGNLSMSERETYETGGGDFDVATDPETSVLAASSSLENAVQKHGDEPQGAIQLLNPVNGTLATDYGQISVTAGGDVKTHMGIDIHVEQKSNVKAALAGMVTKTGASQQYGEYIMIQHDNSLETVYAHCSDILAQTGENVNRGDVIALVGDDSISVGSHLHFEVWSHGNNVDPLEYISVDDG